MSDAGDMVVAHKHSSNHRDEVERSDRCGCFYCSSTYAPSAIIEWVDEIDGRGTTALCPRCGIDSVIGSADSYPLDRDFLSKMNKHWFGGA